MNAISPSEARHAHALRNAMSVDVEDYFQVEAFARVVRRESWDEFPSRVAGNTGRMLDQFARRGVTGTFFTLGWVARRHPQLVRRIVAEGHELASHGFGHARVDTLTAAEFAADVGDAKKLLEDLGGVAVQGYRAPTFSISARTPWAYDVLAASGHSYSSSIYPVRHDLYGAPDAPRFPFTTSAGILEIPMTTLPVLGRNLPCSGGGYFRLLPYTMFRQGLRLFNRNEKRPGLFYIHPWEIDPDQPRIAAAPPRSRFRHYLNLGATTARLDRLLRDFAWGRMDRIFADALAR